MSRVFSLFSNRVELGLAILAFSIPLHKNLSTWGIVLLALLWASTGNWSQKWQRLKSSKLFWAVVSYYLLLWPGMTYTHNYDAGWFDLQQKLPLLLIPIISLGTEKINSRSLASILLAFCAGTVSFCLVAITRALIRTTEIGSAAFYYKELIGFTHLHPTYFALFSFSAIIIIAYLCWKNWKGIDTRIRVLAGLVITGLFLFNFLLSARAEIIAFILLVNFTLLALAIARWKLWKVLLVFLSLNGLAVFLIDTIPYTRYRFRLIFMADEVDYWHSALSRREIWRASTQLISSNPFLGFGTGDAKDALVEQYSKNNFELGVQERFNAHNQYFQAWLSTGILGLLSLLAGLLMPLYLSIKRRAWLYTLLLVFFALSLLAESMLESQMGLVFYAWMQGLLVFHYLPKTE